MQGALELLGIPYTGSGVMASAIAMDKVMTKRVWLAEGLPTPRFVRLAPGEQRRERVLRRARRPRPAADREAAARGLVDRHHQGRGLFADAGRGARSPPRYDPDVLCEEFIEGDEVTCPVLGDGATARALPVVRIVAPDGAYDYQNKYFTDGVQYLCPSGLPAAEEAEIQRLVLAAYRALGCRGWGRADLMLRARDRKPFLLEMNTSPGMTGHSLVPMSARAAGSRTRTSACSCWPRPRSTRRAAAATAHLMPTRRPRRPCQTAAGRCRPTSC